MLQQKGVIVDSLEGQQSPNDAGDFPHNSYQEAGYPRAVNAVENKFPGTIIMTSASTG